MARYPNHTKMNPKEAAAYWGVTIQTVLKWVKRWQGNPELTPRGVGFEQPGGKRGWITIWVPTR